MCGTDEAHLLGQKFKETVTHYFRVGENTSRDNISF